MGHSRTAGPIETLRAEFRETLLLFYSRLNLAAPYDSVEKAVGTLTTTLQALSEGEVAALSTDETNRWTYFRQAVLDSGLNLKHRGIIAGLIRSEPSLNLPPECRPLLEVYRPSR